MQTYKFNVQMSCYGCVNAVIKTLANENITAVDVDFDNQLVTVKTEKSYNDVFDCIKSSGKKVITATA